MTAPIKASSKTKKVKSQIILFWRMGTLSLNDFIKIINVIINKKPTDTLDGGNADMKGTKIALMQS